MRIRTGLIILGIALALLITGVGLGLNEWHTRTEYLASHAAGQRDKQYAANVWIYTFGYEYYGNGEAELVTTRVPWDLNCAGGADTTTGFYAGPDRVTEVE